MKKTLRIVSLVLVVAMALLALVSCSKYSALQKAFEKEGYKENEKLEKVAAEIKEELEEDNLAVTLHLLTKENGITSVLIVEFNSTEDMVKAYEDSETIKGLVKDIKSSEDINAVKEALENAGYAKGNCLCVPLSILYINEITNIVKSVK